MSELLSKLFEHGSIVIVLVIALYAGHRGMWYWGSGVRAIVSTLERERNEWRQLSFISLKKLGIDIPTDMMADPHSVIEYLKGTGKLEL